MNSTSRQRIIPQDFELYDFLRVDSLQWQFILFIMQTLLKYDLLIKMN